MNVHKRCQKNVANNCGIDTKRMAEILNELGVTKEITQKPRKKVRPATRIDLDNGAFFFRDSGVFVSRQGLTLDSFRASVSQ